MTSPYYSDALLTFYHGDVLDTLRQMPDESVQCVVTSPPYWSLRDYGVPGQLGLEPTPAEYVAKMVAVFDEVRRVLRSDGVCWLNLGDSYTGSAQSGGPEGQRLASPMYRVTGVPTKRGVGLKPKDLVGIPWRVAFALQDAGWWLRSDIIWSKPNPMPESVTDRPTKAHEYIFLLTKSARYFYDADAVRTPAKPDPRGPGLHNGYAPAGQTPHTGGLKSGVKHKTDKQRGHGRRHDGFNDRWNAMPKAEQQAMGANLRTVWSVATHPYPAAHFATYPPKLIEPCILAGTSERGACPACGAPWRRVVEREKIIESTSPRYAGVSMRNDAGDARSRHLHTTTGWQPTCDCDAGDPVPCVVLDPFLGSGTTAMVAQNLGRKCIGIDLNSDYLDMAVKRCAQKTLWGMNA